MEVELLYITGCVHRALARQRLVAVLARGGWTAQVREHEVTSAEQADRLGMAGSPTMLIDGHDLFPTPSASAGLGCRLYATPTGLASVPTIEQITDALTDWAAMPSRAGTGAAGKHDARRLP